VLETNYFVGGNGGSAADKSHFATEFVVRFTKDRPASAAICLCGEGGLLTAVGNDYASKKNVLLLRGERRLRFCLPKDFLDSR
jgi:phosphoheptose isomerase